LKDQNLETTVAGLTTMPDALKGLVARGQVLRRQKRQVGDDHTEVVTYTLGPRFVEVEVWAPVAGG
jgi:hypothetical protein